jgi:hypothetical protein
MQNTYSRDGLTVTEIEAFTSLNSPKLELISFKVEFDGESRIDELKYDNDFEMRMIDFICSEGNSKNRAKTYYEMIK